METQTRSKILIVDDDRTNLMYLDNLLSEESTLHMAKNGEQALKRADEHMPDLILLDITMPGMNGYEVLSELKRSDRTRNIPVIFITGLNTYEDEMKGLALGADDYIFKPFNDAVVLLRIRNRLNIINQMRLVLESEIVEKCSLIDMPLIFFRCRKCKREFNSFQDAKDCEMKHLRPVSVSVVQYTIKDWPYQVEVLFDDGSTRLYNADDLSG